MEHSQHIKALYQKYLDDDYSEQELDELLEYFYNSGEHHDLSLMIRSELAKEEDHVQSKGAVKSLLAELDQELFAELKKRSNPVKRIKLWPRIAAAASIAFAIGMGIWFYTSGPEKVGSNPELAGQQDIAPGKNTATLTLANGKTITLSDTRTGVVIGDDKLVYNDGSELGAPQGGSVPGRTSERMLTMATPKGGTYQVTLPDGTKVWLNAASQISFPVQFAEAERNVVLNGEAYFEVAKNKKCPFIVRSKGQKVTVLGTRFNINSYADEAVTKTTLVEGRVRVASNGGARSIVLEPNQQSILGGDKVTIRQANVEEDLDWKNGIFIFKGETIESIMRKVSRWYDVEVIYEPGMRKDLVFGGYVSRSFKISAVLRIMERTGKVKFKIADNRVYVKN